MPLGSLLSVLLPLALQAAAQEKPQDVFEAAEERQTFYPIGSARFGETKADFYVLGGSLSVTGGAINRAAVLHNTVEPSGRRFQIVELGSLKCQDRSFKPTFRMVFNSAGQRLASSGPVVSGEGEGTLLTPDAVGRLGEIICSGIVPAGALPKRVLGDFR